MLAALQYVSFVLVALAFATSVAHALEMPGKLRLDRDTYLAVQKIYYPGFTAAGMAEGVSLPALLALLVVTPAGNWAFWLTLEALIGLVAAHALYWVRIHPVNRAWLKGEKLGQLASGFFGTGTGPEADWTQLRDRWEYSHLVRAILMAVSLLALVVAIDQ